MRNICTADGDNAAVGRYGNAFAGFYIVNAYAEVLFAYITESVPRGFGLVNAFRAGGNVQGCFGRNAVERTFVGRDIGKAFPFAGNRHEACAVVERRSAKRCYALRQGYGLQIEAILKSVFPYVRSAFGYFHVAEALAAVKGVVPDVVRPFCEFQGFQVFAIAECAFAYFGYTACYVYRFKAVATVESVFAYGIERTFDFYRNKTVAFIVFTTDYYSIFYR